MKCIICGSEKTGSSEHIIPEALGNKKLRTDRVCEECNNKLGTNVDSYLTDNIIFKIIRKEQDIRGKSGKEVKLFPSRYTSESGEKYLFRNDEPFPAPSVKLSENSLQIKAGSMEEAKKIAESNLKKLGFTAEQIDKAFSEIPKNHLYEQPEFSFKINFIRIFIAVLKIAYEFAHLIIGDKYLNDDIAVLSKEILLTTMNASKDKLDDVADSFGMRHVSILNEGGRDLLDIVRRNFEKAELDSPVEHMLILHGGAANQLICDVYLFMEPVTSFTVLLSEHCSDYFAAAYPIKMAVVLKNGDFFPV